VRRAPRSGTSRTSPSDRRPVLIAAEFWPPVMRELRERGLVESVLGNGTFITKK
jgi:hypothetical protein